MTDTTTPNLSPLEKAANAANAARFRFYGNLVFAYSPQRAIKCMEQAAELDPTSITIQSDLGRFYEWTGDREKAAKAHDTIVAIAEETKRRVYERMPANSPKP